MTSSGYKIISTNSIELLNIENSVTINGITITSHQYANNKLYLLTSSNLQIYDISDLNNPNLINTYTVSARDISLSGNYLYTTGSLTRMFDVSDPMNITEITNVDVRGNMGYSVTYFNNHLITTHNYNGVGITSISGQTLTLNNALAAGCGSSGTAAHKDNILFLNDDCGITAWDFSDINHPVSKGASISNSDNVWEMQDGLVDGNVLYTSGSGAGLYAFTIDSSGTIQNRWNYSTYDCREGFKIVSTTVYCPSNNEGVLILDITNSTQLPILLGRYYPGNSIFYRGSLHKVGTNLAVTNYTFSSGSQIEILDISDPSVPQHIKHLSAGSSNSMTGDSQYVYYNSGKIIKIIDMNLADPVNVGQITLTDSPESPYSSNNRFNENFYLAHAKIYIIDEEISFLGSMNFTRMGFYNNYESRILIEDLNDVSFISNEFDYLYANNCTTYLDLVSLARSIYEEPPN